MSTSKQLLIVDDDREIRELLNEYLTRAGFEVLTAAEGNEMRQQLAQHSPDLIILDIMMPGDDGFTLCQQIRRDSQVPIIMLTAASDEADRVIGLELGADDYIAKPFSPREVVLRIKAVLRRRQTNEADPEQLEIGRIRLDTGAHRAQVRGAEIPLTATEFRLLKVLMERQGRVQTRSRLLTDVWGYAEDVDSRTVDTHVRRLRRKLGPESDRIETVIGVGYRLRA